jgi:hypothetical protein
MTQTATTLKLTPGQKVSIPATLNSFACTGTVESVEPWILTAGPHAGKQATSGRRQGSGEPLWTVVLVDVQWAADSSVATRYRASAEQMAQDTPVMHMSAPAGREWTLA